MSLNPLESGIAHAGAAYRKARRCALLKQEPRRRFSGEFVGKAPVDFLGTRPGGAIVIEAKQTAEDRFDILDQDAMKPAQITACNELAACGADVYLVIDFTKRIEVYAVPWADVARFLGAPWRSSLSLDFCRAYGLLLPETDRHNAEKRCTFFLDGVRHIDAAVSLARVLAEKSAAAERPAAPEREPRPTKRQLELRARLATPMPNPSTDPDGYRRYVSEALTEGLINAGRRGARKRAGGRR